VRNSPVDTPPLFLPVEIDLYTVQGERLSAQVPVPPPPLYRAFANGAMRTFLLPRDALRRWDGGPLQYYERGHAHLLARGLRCPAAPPAS
jgi:hypothetical protein